MHEDSRIYTCPMHPEIQRDRPGMCPECGMNLVPASAKAAAGKPEKDIDKHAGHSTWMFLRKFWVSLLLTVPVVLYSGILQKFFDWQPPAFPGSQYIPLVLGSIVFFYGGWIFLASAWREIQGRLPGMMTLIAFAISVAYLYSVFASITGRGETLFWELTSLISVMLLGHWIEMRSVQGAQGALKELSKLLPDTAEVLRNGNAKTISLAELQVGDVLIVRPGGRIASDGIVLEGESEVDESLVTGESRPVRKSKNSEVIGGTINGDGSLKITVTKIGERTFLSGVMRLVQEAQSSKSRIQLLADRAAFYLTLIAIAAGAITFGAWVWAAAGFAFAIERLVAVLVVACPHALGLAIPLVASISTTKAARSGFLVRSRLALESARNIQVVLFDKTGTLTEGSFGVDRVIAGGASENEILALAASVDTHSEHPIAKAIVAETRNRKIPFSEAKDFRRLPGQGVEGKTGFSIIAAGGEATIERMNIKKDTKFSAVIAEEAKKGKTIIYVIRDGQLLGAIALADRIRKESREAVSSLKKMGVKTAMITGDAEDVARWVAEDLGIEEYFAKVLPEKKAERVKELQKRGLKVAMVGDGINDAPALAQADLGIAIGAGTNVAIESAGIILIKNDPRDIAKIIRLSQLSYRKMIQNLFWATGYNVAALPLAAGALAFKGVFLEPAVAAVLMSASTVIVAVNAALLSRQKL